VLQNRSCKSSIIFEELESQRDADPDLAAPAPNFMRKKMSQIVLVTSVSINVYNNCNNRKPFEKSPDPNVIIFACKKVGLLHGKVGAGAALKFLRGTGAASK
jgi:hypothetical protein